MGGFYPIQVIPSKRYRNKITGHQTSVYGASPWTGHPGNCEKDWETITIGWTCRNSNETIGNGQRPFATKEAAEAYLAQYGRANHRLPTIEV
jgi:hypothetical protein